MFVKCSRYQENNNDLLQYVRFLYSPALLEGCGTGKRTLFKSPRCIFKLKH